MRDEIQKKNINIDILIAVASHGGVENVINMLGSFLVRRGFHVRLVQLVYEGEDWADDSMEFVHVYDSRDGQDLERLYDGYKKVLSGDARKPDVILATAWPYMSYIAKRATIELELGSVVISYLHAVPRRYEEAGFGGMVALSYADLHFAISDNIAADITSGIEGAHVYRVNNPIKTESVVMSVDRDILKLVYIGRLSKEKRIETIIHALAKSVHAFRLSIIGQGSEEKQLKRLCRQLNVSERVRFLGWQDRPWEACKDAYACILASAYEGFSLTSIEAMACGKAVIGTPVSGVTELVSPGENGFLFPIDNIIGLTEILDGMGDGSLPYIEEKSCIQSAIPFYEDMALEDITLKIYAASRKKILPYRNVRHPRISVIIPCYNVAKYIDRCLEGVLNQTIGLRAMEIIIVNDASTDNTLEILLGYEEKYPDNIMVINCDRQEGDDKCEEIGLQYASGEHVIFLKSDDVIEKNELEDLYILIQTYWMDSISNDDGRVLYRR